ncbi:alpha-methylacyl-CoA racemase-like [Hydractinia symbiolongicarpus]|uniref:alpha-methylacyl-CoA racemase-like n=1 Tax=Hydractinia symbiolongicarpus TaxID=13093 RepID=UPI00254D076E|nr:alpha-methylacyl-CoA racemase-like [Hydractinia symbiolongicarpus]
MATSVAKNLPLSGIRVLEFAGLAPAPFAGMILADFGANVFRVDRAGETSTLDSLSRGKRSISLNLKSKKGVDVIRRLSSNTDILLEPYRPGVMEKFGLGPEALCGVNERLVYTRLNGFGSKGLHSNRAGHDINFLAMSGVLSMLGRKGMNPFPPINLLGDFAGGSMVAVLGILLALFERTLSGKGQVVEASITEGAAYVSSFLQRSQDIGIWFGDRGENVLDSGAPFYETYETKDGRYMAVGAIETKFYQQFVKGLEMDDILADQFNLEQWPSMKQLIAKRFKTKTQAEWVAIFENVDACVTPVLTLDEAHIHPHNVQNKTYMKNSKGGFEPCPAPMLSRTPGISKHRRDPCMGEHTVEILTEEGFSATEIDDLLAGSHAEQYIPKSSL